MDKNRNMKGRSKVCNTYWPGASRTQFLPKPRRDSVVNALPSFSFKISIDYHMDLLSIYSHFLILQLKLRDLCEKLHDKFLEES